MWMDATLDLDGESSDWGANHSSAGMWCEEGYGIDALETMDSTGFVNLCAQRPAPKPAPKRVSVRPGDGTTPAKPRTTAVGELQLPAVERREDGPAAESTADGGGDIAAVAMATIAEAEAGGASDRELLVLYTEVVDEDCDRPTACVRPSSLESITVFPVNAPQTPAPPPRKIYGIESPVPTSANIP
jgi:hypothetical protein